MKTHGFIRAVVFWPLFSLLAGCTGMDGTTVTKKTNPQGQPEYVVDRGVQHAALWLDPLPNPTIHVEFWELDSRHQRPPLQATGELLNAGLKALLRESPESPFFGFSVESLPEYWKQVADASLQSPAWKADPKTAESTVVAKKIVEDVNAHRVWAEAWKANGYTLQLQSLEKVQTCTDPNNPKAKSLCGALIAFKATRDSQP